MIKSFEIENARRIILKIGSSLLIQEKKFNCNWLNSFIDDLVLLKKKDIEIIIVASGAVSLGANYLKINNEKTSLTDKQAFAACGQVILMENFMRAFMKKGMKVAQILLTFSDTEDRRKSLNSRETLKSLLDEGVIPIINENDTVATDELKFGDNDRLASRVAQIIDADLLILLSDVKGLYDDNPKTNKKARLIPIVKNINSKALKFVSDQTNEYGSGGMRTKIEAAEIADTFGCSTVICQGNIKRPISNFKKKKLVLYSFLKIKKRKV
ncbi:MAG: glutamate 5-kinase [Rickettsiales bacterium]|nr:glutamate 5-kinase [Rickettsiales bacterium]